MNGLDAYYNGLLAQHQAEIDRQAYEDEQAELEETEDEGDEE